VKQPTPAIVTQGAVRRLPRLALWLLCWAYVLPGFIGREPWKNADMAAFGYMRALAQSTAPDWNAWLHPQLLGLAPEVDGLLPYWIGAWALQLAPHGIAADLAVRLPFAAMLMLMLSATWYGVYHLGRSSGAQPVAFAFGGEALPTDYARAMADGGLLALMACLGLAQLSHETTPAMVQLCCTALIFYAATALPIGRYWAWIAATLGLWGLALSGAPSMSVLLGTGVTLLLAANRPAADAPRLSPWAVVAWAVLTVLTAVLAWALELWHWRIDVPALHDWRQWRGLGRLLLWFTWPAWPLALWTLWRWRWQLSAWRQHRHLALPLWFVLVSVAATLTTPLGDRSLLLALPALATLAAFALPTLGRSVAALIDWFTLLFFTGCAVVIWIVWLAMQTGVPRAPAANVARLAPGFEASFSALTAAVALLATLGWVALVYWRTARHRAAIWKSMVLPASGAILCWLLLTTLWMPLLDYARSYSPVMNTLARTLGHPSCVQVQNLNRGQIAALQYYGDYRLEPEPASTQCTWLVIAIHKATQDMPPEMTSYDPRVWDLQTRVRRPADNNESFLLLRRVPAQ